MVGDDLGLHHVDRARRGHGGEKDKSAAVTSDGTVGDDGEADGGKGKDGPREVITEPREGVLRVGAGGLDGVTLGLLERRDDAVGEFVGLCLGATVIGHPEGTRCNEDHEASGRERGGSPDRLDTRCESAGERPVEAPRPRRRDEHDKSEHREIRKAHCACLITKAFKVGSGPQGKRAVPRCKHHCLRQGEGHDEGSAGWTTNKRDQDNSREHADGVCRAVDADKGRRA